MGKCDYLWCKHTKQGCFRPDCKFVPTTEYTVWDAFNDLKHAISDAETVYESEPIALDAIEYLKQRLEQIQKVD